VVNEQGAVHHIKYLRLRGVECVGNEQIDAAVLPEDIATGDVNGFRIEIAGLDRPVQFSPLGNRCQRDGCIGPSTGQFQHTQTIPRRLTRHGLQMLKQSRHATADGVDAAQTTQCPVVFRRVKARLIHHLGLPVARHRNQARKHLITLKRAQS